MPIGLGSLRHVVWPSNSSIQQGGVFALVGGAIGLAGDLAGFFTSILTPNLLAILFLLAAGFFAYLCLRKIFTPGPVDDTVVAQRANCVQCDTMRFSLFAVITFGILMLIGQGQSATELVAENLGLLRRDVADIQREVSGLGELTSSQKIITNPRSAQDYFANAWIYSNIHRDQEQAHAALETLYAQTGPNKFDAAELYFASGRATRARGELIRAMEEISDRVSDATLLVVAGRNAPDASESRRLYAKAQEMDPDLPFAWWDVQRLPQNSAETGIDGASQAAMLRGQVEGLTVFIERIGEQPVGRYFFLPQYQPDYEQLARQTLASSQSALETYKKLGL